MKMETTVIILIVLLAVALLGLVAVLVISGRRARAFSDEKMNLVRECEQEKSRTKELEAQIAAREEFEEQLQARQEADRREAERRLAEERQEADRRRAEERQEAERRLAEERREAQAQREREQQAVEQRHAKELESLKEAQKAALESMREQFAALSAKNNDAFREHSEKAIGDLLKPVQEKFKEFSDTVMASQKDAAERHARLDQKIVDLADRSQAVGDEARNLANALTGYSKVQGDFGEMLLTDVLKNAGLTEGIHFFTQGVITDESGREVKSEAGRTLIPDVMVYYPDDTTVIIDSKVSLKAYNDYMSAATVEDRIAAAKAHVESVRSHVNELKVKDYASYIPEGRRKVDFNIMFIPVEGAFRLMLEEDPRLWQVAKDNKVLIVSQMTLIIVLNMIQMSWRQHEQEKNIAAVFATAEELMGQLRGWMEAYVKIGEHLGKASDAYEDARKKLSDSNQSVIKKIDKLEKLGIAPKRSNARIKSTARMVEGGSIIPKELEPEK